jgi:hypothetical protein
MLGWIVLLMGCTLMLYIAGIAIKGFYKVSYKKQIIVLH